MWQLFCNPIFFHMDMMGHPRTPPATCHLDNSSDPYQLPAKLSLRIRSSSNKSYSHHPETPSYKTMKTKPEDW